MPLKLRSGELTLPGNYIYATRATPADTFRPFVSRMALLRVRCQSFADVTAPETLMKPLETTVAE
jgi:hypothetical protein